MRSIQSSSRRTHSPWYVVATAPAVIARSVATKQSMFPRFANAEGWIAHMGNVCVKDGQSPFCLTAATSSSRPRAMQDDARRSSQGRPFRAAA